MKTLISLLCGLGLHDWLYLRKHRSPYNHRVCLHCDIRQSRDPSSRNWRHSYFDI